MKILLVSDREEPYIWDHFDRERFADIGMIISCGDLKAEYLSFLVTMIKAPLFYVPGNHDGSYDRNPPEGCVSIDGKLVIYEGIRLLGFGGSHIYNGKEYQYTQKQMKKRIRRLSWVLRKYKGFDILVSHAPAFGLCDGDDLCHRGFESFRYLLDKYSPRYYVHGHQHLNYGLKPRVTKYGNTTIINAFGYYILDY